MCKVQALFDSGFHLLLNFQQFKTDLENMVEAALLLGKVDRVGDLRIWRIKNIQSIQCSRKPDNKQIKIRRRDFEESFLLDQYHKCGFGERLPGLAFEWMVVVVVVVGDFLSFRELLLRRLLVSFLDWRRYPGAESFLRIDSTAFFPRLTKFNIFISTKPNNCS